MTEHKNSDGPNSLEDQPERIGPYRILDILGEGGMAVVYLAEQTEPVKRRVAIKILKAGMDSRQVVARFESERQALAVLDHPNIAKIFDGGVAENGRPYFAMEHVKGVPLTEYCDDQRLGNEARLQLFVDVCAAVQHAHLKGLIHRDLKPSNILVGVVDRKPQPKIIDFGIAKATTITLTESTLYTKVGQIIGTPQYMSPEQAGVTGLDVDTRTDIYSLGVILYELLVGVVPLDFVGVGDQAMQIALREKDPPRPSTRFTQLDDTRDEIAKVRGTDTEGLKRQLSGDLDWVVMKAIEKDRTRRYETVNALAMECRRILKKEPVLARPPSPGYLLGRFVQRNRILVAASLVAALAIITGASVATLGYIRATEAEQLALQEAETARQVSGFLVELFEVADPSEARGNTITAREVLDRGAEQIETELDDQPAIQATLMETLGSVYMSLGLYDDAQEMLERSLSNRRSLYGPKHSLTARSQSTLGELLGTQAEFDAAEEMLRQALKTQRQVLDVTDHDLHWALLRLADLRSMQGDSAEAVTLYTEVIEVQRQSSVSSSFFLARCLDGLAMALFDQGKIAPAEELLREAIEMQRILTNGSAHPDLSSAINNLAVIFYENGRLEESEELFRESFEMDRQLLGDSHPNVATSMNNLAIILEDSGNYEAAEAMFQSALAMRRELLGKDHPEVAQSLNNLSLLYNKIGKSDQAIDMSRQALATYRQAYPDNHPEVAYGLQNLAGLLRRNGDYAAAETFLEEALQINQSYLDENHPDLASARIGYARLMLQTERPEVALRMSTLAYEVYKELYSDSHVRTANALSIRGASLTRLSRFAEAEPMLVQANQVLNENIQASPRSKEESRRRLVELYNSWGLPDKADRYEPK